jgi:7-cyano-7-deazaguanine synthase
VDSITDCGEIEVFDLVVEETHNYLAGDFITHNSGAFPDNEEQLVHLLDLAAPYTVQAHYGMRMLSPVGTKMKHEIVRMGLDLDAPLEHTISCYKAGERPCNACAPCFMRQEAFRRNGAVDPVA